MKLQTQIPLQKQSNNLIDYNSNILLLGSCFVENIGGKLSYFKFQNSQNPFGILFQPKAIESLISNAINQKEYSETDIFFQNEQWHCFEAHSKLSASSKKELLNELNDQIKLTKKQIHESTHIIITLGTAWVYRFLESNQLVANCHKVPQKQFTKELLSVETITESLKIIINSIRSINTKTSIIFTVSPVRHIKDGFVENMQSKAHLISAIHQIINQNLSNGNSQLVYFPSFEIMMDELRDYRFYAEDMLHPNNLAINYIWEKFIEVWVSNKASKTMKVVDEVQKGIQHKAFNPNSEAHQKFLSGIEEKLVQLQKEYPYMKFQS
ncbi:GSCFA domain-containing protein [Mariniflexile litorale]|uniref:GSCFA domain-containing protein n=1 Tax=Mariniflexile litorale TaxID=3045158 RepID=A0AAU7EBD1_9FLAO|nr:GSCFA domain-containing protein [Mariniflexile sp. KMM 9835]MDQ8213396.1 GSCFA domain-containing protein [Mariniflexile sp. KMM 9835]